MDWDAIINEGALASVLPDEYACFARPVSEALAIFLEGLPEERQASILADQAALPANASVSQRLATLARSCPMLHKMGQVLARDAKLSAELRQHLQQLESLQPKVDLATIERVLTSELGSLGAQGIQLQTPAIAEASVAVVIGYEQTGGADSTAGVFKLLKPDIEERLEQELELAGRVGDHLDERCEDLGIPSIDYRETFEQVRDKLHSEVRLGTEQRNLELARSAYCDDHRVHIPTLQPLCTNRVTAMERLSGSKVTECFPPGCNDRQHLATLVVEALVAQPVFSTSSEAFFHCDPHAGNLLFTNEGRLGILDWSLVGQLSDEERVAIVQIVLAAATLNSSSVVRALDELADRVGSSENLACVAYQWVHRIRHGELPGFSWLVGMLDDAVRQAGLRLCPDMVLLRKTLHSLDGVIRDLHADERRIDEVLIRHFTKQLVIEWPQRWAAMPHYRGFATRLSNFDLTRCLMEIPGTAARFWLGQLSDLLTRPQTSSTEST